MPPLPCRPGPSPGIGPGTGTDGTSAGSVDPNDKLASEGVTPSHCVSGGEALRYAIEFENLATASLPAQEVTIADPLDIANVDLSSLQLGPITLGGTAITPPPGASAFSREIDLRPAKNFLLKIDAGVNTTTGLLTYRFTTLDPATRQRPDDVTIGFLPPNLEPPFGEGEVVFAVKPKPAVATGAQICNQAAIVFDVNPPIATPTRCNTIDNAAPRSRVVPLAAIQRAERFPIQWTATDEGAGVADYSIYVSENGGSFVKLIATAATSAIFTGRADASYRFCSVARDLTGNLEEKDLTTCAEAVTAVRLNHAPTVQCRAVTTSADAACRAAAANVDDGSFDPDGDVLTLSQSPAAPYRLGTTAVTLTATDALGGSATCPATVTVVDATAPVIMRVTAMPPLLRAGGEKQKMVPVTLTVAASDACTAVPVCRIESVTTNDRDHDRDVDWRITGSLTLALRAEHGEHHVVRAYTVGVKCTDASGNSALGTVVVPVAPNGGGRRDDDGDKKEKKDER